jgi:hypothetical protein
MAADDIAKGALQLIRWGKKIIPATADEIKQFGKNAPRVKALLNMVENVSDDAAKLSLQPYTSNAAVQEALDVARNNADNLGRTDQQSNTFDALWKKIKGEPEAGINLARPALYDTAKAEVVSDLLTPHSYMTLTNPMATGRRFDMTAPNAPESFTNIARSLGERGLITAPKDVELARRVSMLPPAMQQVYLDLAGEGTDLAQLLQALRIMGQ